MIRENSACRSLDLTCHCRCWRSVQLLVRRGRLNDLFFFFNSFFSIQGGLKILGSGGAVCGWSFRERSWDGSGNAYRAKLQKGSGNDFIVCFCCPLQRRSKFAFCCSPKALWSILTPQHHYLVVEIVVTNIGAIANDCQCSITKWTSWIFAAVGCCGLRSGAVHRTYSTASWVCAKDRELRLFCVRGLLCVEMQALFQSTVAQDDKT